jgi:glyoxylase-like metal-dependent hydrolase (beta-lactamase superfamily II)
MLRRLIICLVLPVLAGAGCTSPEPEVTAAPAQSAAQVLNDVVAAMGMDGVNSITYAGRAWRIRNGWMQTPHADAPWPYRDEITNYRRAIDLRQPASLARGDTFAQNLFLAPATAGTYTQNIPADSTAWANRLEIYLTPWGFLKGAADNGVELTSGKLDGVEYRVLSWMTPESQISPSGLRYTVNGYINDDNLIAGVETWVEDAFMGDFHVLQVSRDYRELNGLMVPQTIEQHRGGGGVFGVILTDASANPQSLSELLVAPQGGGGGFGGGGGGGNAPTDIVEAVGENVWLVTGGYVALVAEFEDYVMVFEAGQNEARGETILAEVTALIPDKPIRYLVNSHPHSDHTGGIVPFIRNGTTLITHANNERFLEMALGTPRTLLGEETLDPDIEGVDGITVYEDSMNRVELHSVPNGHTDGMLVAVLPRAGILFQADFTLPQPGQEPNPFVVTLAQYVAEVDPDFERYLAVHAAAVPQTKADLLATIGL